MNQKYKHHQVQSEVILMIENGLHLQGNDHQKQRVLKYFEELDYFRYYIESEGIDQQFIQAEIHKFQFKFFPAGSMLQTNVMPCGKFFLILKGEVGCYQDLQYLDDQRQLKKIQELVYKIPEGGGFGGMNIILKSNSSFTVKCQTDCFIGVMLQQNFVENLSDLEVEQFRSLMHSVKNSMPFQNAQTQSLKNIVLNGFIERFEQGDDVKNLYNNLSAPLVAVILKGEFAEEILEEQQRYKQKVQQSLRTSIYGQDGKERPKMKKLNQYRICQLGIQDLMGDQEFSEKEKRKIRIECQTQTGLILKVLKEDLYQIVSLDPQATDSFEIYHKNQQNFIDENLSSLHKVEKSEQMVQVSPGDQQAPIPQIKSSNSFDAQNIIINLLSNRNGKTSIYEAYEQNDDSNKQISVRWEPRDADSFSSSPQNQQNIHRNINSLYNSYKVNKSQIDSQAEQNILYFAQSNDRDKLQSNKFEPQYSIQLDEDNRRHNQQFYLPSISSKQKSYSQQPQNQIKSAPSVLSLNNKELKQFQSKGDDYKFYETRRLDLSQNQHSNLYHLNNSNNIDSLRSYMNKKHTDQSLFIQDDSESKQRRVFQKNNSIDAMIKTADSFNLEQILGIVDKEQFEKNKNLIPNPCIKMRNKENSIIKEYFGNQEEIISSERMNRLGKYGLQSIIDNSKRNSKSNSDILDYSSSIPLFPESQEALKSKNNTRRVRFQDDLK